MKSVLIVGLGISGISAALLAKRVGLKVYVTEAKRDAKNDEKFLLLEKEGIEYEIGNSEKFFNKVDFAVISPGISLESPYILKLREKVDIISEIEFAYGYNNAKKIIGITGTNGKSTVTTLIYEIFKKNGFKTALAGNIGFPLSDYVDKNYDIIVCEISSYQLETIRNFKADSALLLNLTPDHLNRYHQNMREYLDAKLNIFKNQTEDDFAIINSNMYEKEYVRKHIKASFFQFGRDIGTNAGAFVEGNIVKYRNLGGEITEIINTEDIKIPGEHNLENVLASICAVMPYVSDVDNTDIADEDNLQNTDQDPDDVISKDNGCSCILI